MGTVTGGSGGDGTRHASGVQRRLLLRRGEGPGRLAAPLLAEDETQLARRSQAVRVVRAERRTRRVEVERAQRVAPEEAVLARDGARRRLRLQVASMSVRG